MVTGSLLMPRKPKTPKTEQDASSDEGGGTQQIRVNADLADKLALIVKKRKTTSAKLLDPIIRPFINDLFAQVQREISTMQRTWPAPKQ